MKKQTLCKLFALITSLLLVCGMCFTASAQETEKGVFDIEGTTLKKYTGPGGEVTVPDGIEVLGEWAFDSSKVTKVNLPESLKEIESYCFFDCHQLTEITLPASLETLSDAQAFAFDSNLQAINVAEGNPYYTSVDGVLFNKSRPNAAAGRRPGAAAPTPRRRPGRGAPGSHPPSPRATEAFAKAGSPEPPAPRRAGRPTEFPKAFHAPPFAHPMRRASGAFRITL